MSDPNDLFSFLLSLDRSLREDLYTDAHSALTIFRCLPAFAKHYILRLLCLDTDHNPVHRDMLKNCVLPSHMPYHREALYKLRALGILLEYQTKASSTSLSQWCIKLHDNFRNSLEKTICGKAKLSLKPDAKRLSPKQTKKLQAECQKTWEKLVHYLVGSEIHGPASKLLKKLIENVGLMVKGKVTMSGFQFLYQPLHEQIWKIIVGYMSNCESRSLDQKEVLTFLFEIAFLPMGSKLSKSDLTSTQRVLVNDLQHMGLVWCQGSKKSLFIPSHLALYLSSGMSPKKEEVERKGYIIVETTFDIYAYTDSPLQIGLISKFARIDYRFPNLIRGKIVKDKVLEVLEAGISVDLILAYLNDYAHPNMRKNNPMIPVNVTDRIRLWNEERTRLKATPGFLVSGFTNLAQYQYYVRILEERDMESAAEQLECPITTMDVINLVDDQNKDPNMTDKMRTDEISPAIRRMLRNTPGFRNKYELILQQYSWQGIGFLRSLDKESRAGIKKRLTKLHTKPKKSLDMCLLWKSDERKSFCVTEKGKIKLKQQRMRDKRERNQRYQNRAF